MSRCAAESDFVEFKTISEWGRTRTQRLRDSPFKGLSSSESDILEATGSQGCRERDCTLASTVGARVLPAMLEMTRYVPVELELKFTRALPYRAKSSRLRRR